MRFQKMVRRAGLEPVIWQIMSLLLYPIELTALLLKMADYRRPTNHWAHHQIRLRL